MRHIRTMGTQKMYITVAYSDGSDEILELTVVNQARQYHPHSTLRDMKERMSRGR